MRGPYYWPLQEQEEARAVFATLKCDPRGIELMDKKSRLYPFLLKEVPSPAANALKQHMLSLGGEAVVGRGVIDMSQSESDVLLLGTPRHYRVLLEKLPYQPWGLKSMAVRIRQLLESLEVKQTLRWNWQDRSLEIGNKTLIMGILNLTPDSFSDGGSYPDADAALRHACRMVEEGAHIIDVGGESTRPGSSSVSSDEELERVMPVLERLLQEVPVPISVDTYKSGVAEEALRLGAHIINDVGGGRLDPQMAAIAARAGAPVVIMHNPAEPVLENVILQVVDDLACGLDAYRRAGVAEDKLVVDQGIGFGKDWRGNLEILHWLDALRTLGKPVLLGTSRKSFIGRLLNNLPPQEREEGTLATSAWGVQHGASILRVHDVRGTARLVRVLEAMRDPEGVVL